jgi:hypothetical protein
MIKYYITILSKVKTDIPLKQAILKLTESLKPIMIFKGYCAPEYR